MTILGFGRRSKPNKEKGLWKALPYRRGEGVLFGQRFARKRDSGEIVMRIRAVPTASYKSFAARWKKPYSGGQGAACIRHVIGKCAKIRLARGRWLCELITSAECQPC